MTTWTVVVDSPIGTLRLLADGAGALTHLLVGDEGRPWTGRSEARDDVRPFTDVVTQLEEYFAGRRRDFDLPLAPDGSPFQIAAWAALREIPYGVTRSYTEQAAAMGRPTAVRAVGAANGRNPIAIIVPCHRVVGRDGSLTGYGGGIDRKGWLLGHERARLTLG